ncbi:MAG: hypothetical protein IPI46_04785 [Bacteroidetes bacterium]|nr:hypothetical protein [Bacteroidota bacterium]
MKKIYASMALVSLCLSTSLFAQHDTVYLNQNFLPTSKQMAAFYRVVIDSAQGIFNMIDYRRDHSIYCKGQYSSSKAIIKEGYFQYYHPNGKLSSEGLYHLGIKDSVWVHYYNHGKVKEIHTYLRGAWCDVKRYDSLHDWVFESGRLTNDGRKTGLWTSFHYLSNAPKLISRFENGFLQGEQLEYFKNGTLKRRECIKGYAKTKTEQFDEKGNAVKYFPAFAYPEPPENIKKYLSHRVKCFDETLKASDIQYRLTVKADGHVQDIDIVSPMDEICKQKILICMANMKKWKPYRRENIAYDFTIEKTIRYNSPRE